MSRPLMQHGVQQLREMFDRSKADAGVLRQLAEELQHRQVPRASVLLAEVRAAIASASAVGVPGSVAPPVSRAGPARQQDLWTRPPPPPPVPGSAPPSHMPVAMPSLGAPSAATPRPVRTVSTLTAEDACKVLKTTLGATWESIEQTRRLLVQQSSPSRTSTLSAEKRAQALAEARRVNDASATLSRIRQTGQ